MSKTIKKLVNNSYYLWSKECPDCMGTGYDLGDGGQCDTCSGRGEI